VERRKLSVYLPIGWPTLALRGRRLSQRLQELFG
jgi:hypothetical protein